jgi:hypothetical protein
MILQDDPPIGHHCGIGKRSLAVGLPGVDVYTRTLLLEPTIRAANGMDRVHLRWTAWDVRRTRPAAVTPPMCAGIPRPRSLQNHSAVNHQDLASHVIGRRRSQEPDSANDVTGLGGTAEQDRSGKILHGLAGR